MTHEERQSVLLIALTAAFCDGQKSEQEREQIRGLMESLEVPNASGLIQQVLLKKTTLREAVVPLKSPEARALAYEMAVGVIEADGHRNAAESALLAELAPLLQLSSDDAAKPLAVADSLTESTRLPTPSAPPVTPKPAALTPELEASIRNAAILAGALELLPQSVATLGVIPLQTHLVYRVGKHHGISLDAGHVKEFIGVVGVGLTSQAFEGMARKFLGGLVRRAGGGLAGSLASAATGPVLTFATTYALGQLAHRYYAGGRTLSALQLKETFQQLVGSARTQGEQLLPAIRARAGNLNLSQLPSLVRGV